MKDKRCCTQTVDDNGMCAATSEVRPLQLCKADKECGPGLECRRMSLTDERHRCGVPVLKLVGAACSSPSVCMSRQCLGGKCAAACIPDAQACETADEKARGRHCCAGEICLETSAGSGSYKCKAVGGGGCNQAGTTCNASARRGSEGSAGNNCCGTCGTDGRCH